MYFLWYAKTILIQCSSEILVVIPVVNGFGWEVTVVIGDAALFLLFLLLFVIFASKRSKLYSSIVSGVEDIESIEDSECCTLHATKSLYSQIGWSSVCSFLRSLINVRQYPQSQYIFSEHDEKPMHETCAKSTQRPHLRVSSWVQKLSKHTLQHLSLRNGFPHKSNRAFLSFLRMNLTPTNYHSFRKINDALQLSDTDRMDVVHYLKTGNKGRIIPLRSIDIRNLLMSLQYVLSPIAYILARNRLANAQLTEMDKILMLSYINMNSFTNLEEELYFIVEVITLTHTT